MLLIPKPRKPLSQAKSLRPFSLISFILKTREKLLDRHVKDGVLVERPLHQNQFAMGQICLLKRLFSGLFIGWKSP